MVVIKKTYNDVETEIKELVLIHDSGELDISLIFVELTIIESIRNIFYTGEIAFVDQYRLRETLPFKGTEKIRITWKTSLSENYRTNTFLVKAIPSIQIKRTNATEIIHFQLVDERYKLMLSDQYFNYYEDSTINTIVSDICSNHNVSVTTGVDTTGITFFNTFKSSLKAIEYLRKMNDKPYIFFQQNNSMIFKSYLELFSQNISTKFITIPENNKKTLISNWNKNDIYDISDIYSLGGNGYKKFNSDSFSDSFSTENKSLSNAKFNYDETFLNIKYNEDSSYIEKNYYNDYISFNVNYADSSIMCGMVIDIDMWINISEKSVSRYSGKSLITDVKHTIDSSLKYQQEIMIIKENPVAIL